ncbi:MAG: OmpA family protein [Zoogloeaceae bacterium]|jgi:outer membrane protein OmpA-like peptidoglycan-associated protein|nr:OmpA family protein [Zoogloeaceae bacterium]
MTRGLLFLMAIFLLSAHGAAQDVAPVADAGHEQVDVISFFNGGYPYGVRSATQYATQHAFISGVRAKNDHFFPRNRQEKYADIFYALSAPAKVETFRIASKGSRSQVPRRIEFAMSGNPADGFQPVAVFDVPPSYYTPRGDGKVSYEVSYDFSIPASQRVPGRYLRVRLSGSEWNSYKVSRLNAYGRFEQTARMREDFSGIYSVLGGSETPKTPADRIMSRHWQQGTTQRPVMVLQQEGGQVKGCYVYGDSSGKLNKHVDEVLGTFTGGVEGNLFRFTRTHAADGSQNQGVMALAPTGVGIKPNDMFGAHMVVLNDAPPGGKATEPVAYHIVRSSSTSVPCALAGQKEKSASETLAENLEKTGKAQLYGVNFDFDADTLRPESGAVLDDVVKLAQANPTWKFEIGGHTDSIGSADYNLKLSERRAASVVRYLTGKGVDAARLRAKGYGASRPLVAETDGNDAARAQNRRVELVKQ